MTEDNPLARAYEFARAAHSSINQKRKYSQEPYDTHPREVAEILIAAGETNREVLCAAYLHDVLEDVYPVNGEYGPNEIRELFGDTVLSYVQDLTDEFIHERYPDMNRDARKEAEANRIATICDESLRIKLADLIHNSGDIMKRDPGFGRVYLREKRRVMDKITPRMMESKDPVLLTLYHRAMTQLKYHESK